MGITLGMIPDHLANKPRAQSFDVSNSRALVFSRKYGFGVNGDYHCVHSRV
jgi:hypothetical protein